MRLWPNGRRQEVTMARHGDTCLFSAVVAPRATVGASPRARAAAVRRSWFRNRLGALVCFGLDRKGRLVGCIEQPMETLDDEELALYVETVARESDRFEYAVLGTRE